MGYLEHVHSDMPPRFHLLTVMLIEQSSLFVSFSQTQPWIYKAQVKQETCFISTCIQSLPAYLFFIPVFKVFMFDLLILPRILAVCSKRNSIYILELKGPRGRWKELMGSRYNQNTLYICIEFPKNKSKQIFSQEFQSLRFRLQLDELIIHLQVCDYSTWFLAGSSTWYEVGR